MQAGITSPSEPNRALASLHPGTASEQAFEQAILNHVLYTCVRQPEFASAADYYRAIAHAVRDRLVQRWLATQETYLKKDAKQVCYLSSEFLTGRSLGLCLLNLGLYGQAETFLAERGIDISQVMEQESDAGLGNGGLGRLAACFMDSLATLALPAIGYGIRYDYGIFEQRFEHGEQVEYPDGWLQQGNPWEVPRHEHTQSVTMYGHIENRVSPDGEATQEWVDGVTIQGVPYDSFIVGHEVENVNTLRLWAARAPRDFDLGHFNEGNYYGAVSQKVEVESISKVLYPADHTMEGKELRLKQQYFFVACSLADALSRFKLRHHDFSLLPEKFAIQLNDTHPAVAVAELMRLLVDVEGVAWDAAWEITQRVFGYTNHTLLPEALERWPVSLFERVLPRHLQIIYAINERFMADVAARFPGDLERMRRMSLIEEGPHKQVRMAHLATVGSHSINGVAALHSELIKSQLLPDFFEMYPERFNNKTNGVTPRRWLLGANPKLSRLIGELLDPKYAAFDLRQLSGLRAFMRDGDVLAKLREVKTQNKHRLLEITHQLTGIWLNPDSMFIVQVKRIHEYKRQLLAALGIIARYLELKESGTLGKNARTYLFAGKAAPGYLTAKHHIRFINDVAEVINHDASTHDHLMAAFLPNYSVSLAQRIIPAADVSLQISLAGKEASGTGNMKLALNGAVTLGTLDGANVEIRDAVGDENFLLFGLDVAGAQALQRAGYKPQEFIDKSPRLRKVIEAIESGMFCPGDRHRHQGIASYLRHHDPYLICADFDAYVDGEARADALYADPERFAQVSLANIAGGGHFSSDDTIAAYARDIWDIQPVPITPPG